MNNDNDVYKLWGDRMSKPTEDSVHQLNASFSFDIRLYEEDVLGSLAWARSLASIGILSQDELVEICSGLEEVRREFEEQTFKHHPSDEDIHTAIERRLSEIIGPVAGKLHSGRSRNDQVATDFRLWVMGASQTVINNITDLCHAMLKNAETDPGTTMPGYTHLQHAQPVTWAHWILSHLWPLLRDRTRFHAARASAAVLPLGSGALAGTSFPIDRHEIAKDLGFSAVSQNSIDAVSDRDFAIEFLFASTLLGVHLSRLAEALILFNSNEFGFIELDDAYVTGSSLMPQKKNPDPLELTRGKTGRLIGHLVGLLTTLKGLPSAYDKDLQEDKEPVFDTFDTLNLILPVLTGLMGTLKINPDRMASKLEINLLATDLVDDLVRRSVPFREAHRWVSNAIRIAEEQKVPISELPDEVFRTIHEDFEVDLEGILDYQASLAQKTAIGGTSKAALALQITEARKAIG